MRKVEGYSRFGLPGIRGPRIGARTLIVNFSTSQGPARLRVPSRQEHRTMPQPPIDGTWIRFFGRRTGDAGIVARWVKIGTLYEGYWQTLSGARLAAFDFDRWEVAELPKNPA